MTYIEKAKSVYTTGHAKLEELTTTLDTIKRVSFKVPTIQYRQLVIYHHKMKIDLDELNVCLSIHDMMEDPDDETIASVIRAEAEVFASICDIDERIQLLLSA